MEHRENMRARGAKYETEAARYLARQGYRIVERNFRCRYGEIDMIARKDSYLVFIEVKYRKTAAMGMPQEAVDRKKQRVISRVADYYCLKHGYSEVTPCRFDVVAILGDEITIIENAFEHR